MECGQMVAKGSVREHVIGVLKTAQVIVVLGPQHRRERILVDDAAFGRKCGGGELVAVSTSVSENSVSDMACNTIDTRATPGVWW